MGGGQDKPAWTVCPTGLKVTRVGGKISWDSFSPPGGKLTAVGLPPPGGKLSRGQDKLGHRHILSWRLGHENISMAILPLPLIQEEPLSVTGERMCTKYW